MAQQVPEKISQLDLVTAPTAELYVPLVTGNTTVRMDKASFLGGVYDIRAYGAVAGVNTDAVASVNTRAFETILGVIAAAGGGIIQVPQGVFYLAEGTLLATVCLQLGASVSNVYIQGMGESTSFLKLKDSGASHVINIDGATNVRIASLTIDGNRSANTGTSWHGIRTGSSGVTGLVLEDITVQNTRGYGFGLQGGNKKRLRMSRCTVQDTGLDGCDFKNTSDDNQDVVITAYSAKRWGLDGSVTEQAGLDCRGPCQISGVWCAEGPADGHYIRFREGEIADASLGAQRSHLTNFVCEGNSGATSIGVYCPAHDVDIVGGYIANCFLGVVAAGERVTMSGVTAESCDDESFQVNVTAENCRLVSCHSLSATGSGFRIRGPRCKMLGCSSGLDTVAGIITEATAADFQSTGFDVEGTGGTMVGVDIASTDATVIGGSATGCFRGYSTAAARTKFIGCCARSNTDDGILVGAAGDDVLISGCSSVSNTDDGIVLRADRARVLGCIITGNAGTGLDIIAGADENRIDGNYFASNGTALGDAGLNTRVGFMNDGLSGSFAKPTVTGSKGANAALTSLLSQLAGLGVITDSSS